MSKHKRFADNAGFIQHCWECVHATDWQRVDSIDVQEGKCVLTGRKVGKYDSPNNICSRIPSGCEYAEVIE